MEAPKEIFIPPKVDYETGNIIEGYADIWSEEPDNHHEVSYTRTDIANKEKEALKDELSEGADFLEYIVSKEKEELMKCLEIMKEFINDNYKGDVSGKIVAYANRILKN